MTCTKLSFVGVGPVTWSLQTDSTNPHPRTPYLDAYEDKGEATQTLPRGVCNMGGLNNYWGFLYHIYSISYPQNPAHTNHSRRSGLWAVEGEHNSPSHWPERRLCPLSHVGGTLSLVTPPWNLWTASEAAFCGCWPLSVLDSTDRRQATCNSQRTSCRDCPWIRSLENKRVLLQHCWLKANLTGLLLLLCQRQSAQFPGLHMPETLYVWFDNVRMRDTRAGPLNAVHTEGSQGVTVNTD